jgi:hypothetical protein
MIPLVHMCITPREPRKVLLLTAVTPVGICWSARAPTATVQTKSPNAFFIFNNRYEIKASHLGGYDPSLTSQVSSLGEAIDLSRAWTRTRRDAPGSALPSKPPVAGSQPSRTIMAAYAL